MPWSDLFPRLAVFPLHPIEDGRCGCGNAECTDMGKHPDGPWGDIGPAEKRRSRHHPRAGYGIATGQRSGLFVVDCDGAEGLSAFKALGPCPLTFEVARGQGRHFYFSYPDRRVPNTRSALAPKVDTRGDGGYIVAPGSPHKTGDRYVIVNDVDPAPAPDWLVAWLEEHGKAGDIFVQAYEGDVTGEDLAYHREVYREYLAEAPPCIERNGGDAQLWRVVQYGAYDLALPAEVVLEDVRDIYDPRCQPPWGSDLERRVNHKIRCAKEHSTRPPNCPIPRELAMVEAAPVPGFEEALASPPPAAEYEAKLRLTWGDWHVEVPPPRYIVQDVVPFDTVGMIVAKGSSLKTWMALSIALAVSEGEPWLGTFAAEKGAVIIVDYESGSWQLRNRAKQLGAGPTPNLAHANFPGLRIDDKEFWIALGHACKARGVKLVIVDSFAAGAAGVDENDAKAALPLTMAATFTDAVQCSVVFIHHAKKGEGGDERDLVRGTGAIYAALDWAVTMIPVDENRTRMKVRCIKPWGQRPEDFGIVLTDDGSLLLDVDAAEPAEENIEAAVLAALVKPVGNKELLAKMLGKRKIDVAPYVDALVAKRKIVKLPIVGYVLDDDAKRIERVKESLEGAPCRSIPDLAKRACVDELYLNDLYRKGELCLSGKQYMFAGQNTD